jgi:hypothetical protein
MAKKKAARAAELTTIEKVKAELVAIGDDLPALRNHCLTWATIALDGQQVARDSVAGWTEANEQVRQFVKVCESREALH